MDYFESLSASEGHSVRCTVVLLLSALSHFENTLRHPRVLLHKWRDPDYKRAPMPLTPTTQSGNINDEQGSFTIDVSSRACSFCFFLLYPASKIRSDTPESYCISEEIQRWTRTVHPWISSLMLRTLTGVRRALKHFPCTLPSHSYNNSQY